MTDYNQTFYLINKKLDRLNERVMWVSVIIIGLLVKIAFFN